MHIKDSKKLRIYTGIHLKEPNSSEIYELLTAEDLCQLSQFSGLVQLSTTAGSSKNWQNNQEINAFTT